MTRINCIPVTELVDKHLLAEYRELPRVLRLARHPKAKEVFPSEYTLGAGHVKFFYDKLEYLAIRYYNIVRECKRRGFKIQYEALPEYLVVSRPLSLWNDWKPTKQAMELNRQRIKERLNG